MTLTVTRNQERWDEIDEIAFRLFVRRLILAVNRTGSPVLRDALEGIRMKR